LQSIHIGQNLPDFGSGKQKAITKSLFVDDSFVRLADSHQRFKSNPDPKSITPASPLFTQC